MSKVQHWFIGKLALPSLLAVVGGGIPVHCLPLRCTFKHIGLRKQTVYSSLFDTKILYSSLPVLIESLLAS